MNDIIEQEIAIIKGKKPAGMRKLTVYAGQSILIEDSENHEYYTAQDNREAINNIANWLITGQLSGNGKK
jgi:predicted NAD-dependent protein-ADP-ribosyltransferase YbiA (DUF1768 family)